ncbi:hypothetical protein GQ600_21144 [Phytophthora cactorum]|nr:hypothetical protein GQ600_21144 [Phytophthora cactorum]
MTVWKTSRDRELIKGLNARREADEPSVQDDVFRVVTSFNTVAAETTSLGTEWPRSIELLSMKKKEGDGKSHCWVIVLVGVSSTAFIRCANSNAFTLHLQAITDKWHQRYGAEVNNGVLNIVFLLTLI